MISFRDETAKRLNAELIVYTNEAGKAAGVTPFTHGAPLHRHHEDRGAQAGARQVRLRCRHRWRAPRRREVARQGARVQLPRFAASLGSEEPASRALEPLQRPAAPRRQHPRVPAVELDRDRHLDLHPHREHPGGAAVLRQAASDRRPRRAQDHGRRRSSAAEAGEKPHLETVRFRSLGCYPLTGAQVSKADNVPAIIEEMLRTTTSERQSRAIDADSAAAMENRKREGYF